MSGNTTGLSKPKIVCRHVPLAIGKEKTLCCSSSCRVRLKPDGTRWRTGGEVKEKMASGVLASTLTLPRNVVYPALLPLMRTPRLPAVDWTDAPADLNGLFRFGGRRNLVSARVPSRFRRTLHRVLLVVLLHPLSLTLSLSLSNPDLLLSESCSLTWPLCDTVLSSNNFYYPHLQLPLSQFPVRIICSPFTASLFTATFRVISTAMLRCLLCQQITLSS